MNNEQCFESLKFAIFITPLLKLSLLRSKYRSSYLCSIELETTTHNFLRCYFYNANRSAHMNDLNEVDSSFSKLNENKFIDFVLCGSNKFDCKTSRKIVIFSTPEIWRALAVIIWVLLWSEFAYYIYIYIYICICVCML